MEITKETIRSWGIEIPISRAIDRLGLPDESNKEQWIDFIYGLFEFMIDESQWQS